ncbi:hypothetical protein TWF679_005515 [Orbilia oligospora]|uniref:Uncharacterized protein n=1 Tax=Orbilia oligospora TaxID=2813651 RepID=A0A8H8VBP9_ORBOL|nr:hypothetical protein TWF679_005515 [Orbilia oligospora]
MRIVKEEDYDVRAGAGGNTQKRFRCHVSVLLNVQLPKTSLPDSQFHFPAGEGSKTNGAKEALGLSKVFDDFTLVSRGI